MKNKTELAKLEVSKRITLEGRILDAINNTKKNMQTVISIGIPLEEQDELLGKLVYSTNEKPTLDLKLQSLFGIPVKTSKKLSITTEI